MKKMTIWRMIKLHCRKDINNFQKNSILKLYKLLMLKNKLKINFELKSLEGLESLNEKKKIIIDFLVRKNGINSIFVLEINENHIDLHELTSDNREFITKDFDSDFIIEFLKKILEELKCLK